MPSSRIVLITAIAGALLLAGFLWRETGEKAPEVHAARAPTASKAPPFSWSSAQARRENSPLQTQAALSANPQATPQTRALAATAAAPAAPAVPVVLYFYRRMNDPDKKIEGSIENRSNENLSITLSVSSAGASPIARTMLELAPQARVIIGRDDGMNLAQGDQITVQSAAYSDWAQVIERVH